MLKGSRPFVFLMLILATVGMMAVAGAADGAGRSPERLRPTTCPPFHLRDEAGRIINPVADPETGEPYSPRRTCGACHDYSRVTAGYHFQQGADVMSDDFGSGEGRPWDLSDGMVGKFNHMYIRQLAKKAFRNVREIDLTAYEWVAECGVCHPGGGIMERDRDGHVYDIRQMTDPELAELFDGDYHNARWSESGVVEADCLICHLAEGYDYGIRVEQLRKLNYRWAGTAAAGLGGIVGSVAEGDVPHVVYNQRLFNVDGKVKLPIRRPADRNCLHCHDEASVKSRGITWHDHFNHDIHSHAGIRCIDCHTGDIDHNFAKGFSRELTVRDYLDGTMLSCEQCHTEGTFGAPKMRHRGLPPIHLDKLSCAACHVPSEQIVALVAADMSTGRILNVPNVPGAEKYGEVAEWLPVYEIGDDGSVYPYNNVIPVWWGHKEGAIIYPLFLKEVQAAYAQVVQSMYEERKPVITEAEPADDTEKEIPPEILREILAELDDNGDGRPEVNTEQEIRAMLQALRSVKTRFDAIGPVYVKGNRVYELDGGGQLVSSAAPTAEPLHWPLSHNVAPLDYTLGVAACTDCHAANSHFFFGAATVDPFGPDGEAVTAPMHEQLGYSRSVLLLSAWREGTLKPAAPWIVSALVLIILMHFSLYGSRNRDKRYVPDVLRFRVHERLTHLALMLAVTFLAVTGFLFLLGRHDPLGPWARQVHPIVGFVAAASVLATLAYWARQMVFAAGDGRWIRRLGGYFGGEKKLPAGKFNAGQKVFFWLAALLGIVLAVTGLLMYIFRGTRNPYLPLLYTLHDVAALLMLCTVLGHVYLGVLVNPHTLRTLFGGKVSAIWAKEHHPDWELPSESSQSAER